ncbi:MAG: hypothetical protein KatS3mg119_0833 [Rhodothalassiaceae bacterium]|nr:MAG: hypothetical protein KatS3mg119_0833 [Rhodothalassiaceae bacterium]
MFSGRKKKPERPVWSHKTEEGFLERFLKGETEEDALAATQAGAPQPAPARTEASEQAPTAEGKAELPAADVLPTADELKERIIAALRQIYDPEIPVNIYDLGLVYDVTVSDEGDVKVIMTLTTPHCPVAESMPYEVEARLLGVEGVRDVEVHLVWDPPWDMSRMSDEARLELGLL